MEAIIFDIKGPYGLFKKPYSATSPVSFPLPPPTAIFGMVGAIIGLDKKEYLKRINASSIDSVLVGVQLLHPIQRYRTGINLLRTKGTRYFRPSSKEPRTQVPMEFLKDPAFRIVFAHDDKGLLDDLEQHLKYEKTEYTPVLGLAQCIADVSLVGRSEVEDVEADSETQLNCVIPLTTSGAEVFFEPGVRLTRLRVPSRMESDRTVTRYEDVILDEAARPEGIRVRVEKYHRVRGIDILLF